VQAAMDGEHGVLPVIEVTQQNPLVWRYKNVDLVAVADLEKRVPDAFLTENGMDINDAALAYLEPLIKVERPLAFTNGLPDIHPLQFTLLPKKLAAYKAEK